MLGPHAEQAYLNCWKKKREKDTDRETKTSQWNEKTEVRVRKRTKLLKIEANSNSKINPGLGKSGKAEHLKVFIKHGVSSVKSQEAAKCLFNKGKNYISIPCLLGWNLVWAVTSATLVIWGTVGPGRKWVCLCVSIVFTALLASRFLLPFHCVHKVLV